MNVPTKVQNNSSCCNLSSCSLSHLENLPTEIHILILLQVSSPKDLYSLVRASPRLHGAYRLVRKRVLSRVMIKHAFHRAVLDDALMLVLAKSELPRGGLDGETLFERFEYLLSIWTAITSMATIPLMISIPLCQLYFLVDCYVRQYNSYAQRNFRYSLDPFHQLSPRAQLMRQKINTKHGKVETPQSGNSL